MPDENKSKYVYQFPKEELNKALEQLHAGIIPLASDEFMAEVKLLEKEYLETAFDDDDSMIDRTDDSAIYARQKMLKERIDKERHKAYTNDVALISISEAQKEEIRKQMSVSIVRPDPNDTYNIPDDQLFKNKESKEVYEKLKGIKNCYYNQADFTNAITIIAEAIEFSLGKTGHGEYPWMSYKEALDQFNKGKIKFKWCTIPKLIINRVSAIGDPEILKGVVNGEVVLLNKVDDEDTVRRMNHKRNQQYKPVSVEYSVESNAAYDQMVAAHKAGYDTPWSTAIRYKATSYDPSAMPLSSIFGRTINNNIEQNRPLLFDWTKEGAGEEYFNMLHSRKTKTNDIASLINTNNGGMINPIVSDNMNNFLRSMGRPLDDRSGGYNYNLPNFVQPCENPLKFNEDAAMVERSLLSSIMMNNPIK